MSYFQTTIMDDLWTFYVIDDGDDIIAEGSVAETDFPNKEIHFKRSNIDLRTVVHEMFHVYAGYLYLKDTHEMSVGDIEEIYAAMFEDKAEKILLKAKEIHKKLLEIKNEDQN